MELPVISSDNGDYVILERISQDQHGGLFIVRRKEVESLADMQMLLLRKIQYKDLKQVNKALKKVWS